MRCSTPAASAWRGRFGITPAPRAWTSAASAPDSFSVAPRRFTTGEPGTGTPTDREGEGTMKALTWHGRRDVRVETVPDPTIEQDTDAIVRVTSSGICGSDLHLYEVLGAFLEEGDILGHEPMGIVEAVGSGVSHIQPRGRGVGPVNNSRGHCFICNQGPFSPGEA